MPIERFAPEGVYDTRPLGFTQMLSVSDSRLLVLSGLVAFDKELKTVGRTVPEQLAQALKNARIALGEAGATAQDLIHIRMYVCGLSPELMPGIQAVLRDPEFPVAGACSTLLGVAALARPDVLVEIEVMAAIPLQLSIKPTQTVRNRE